jgi:hypothetical protein
MGERGNGKGLVACRKDEEKKKGGGYHPKCQFCDQGTNVAISGGRGKERKW